MGGVKPEAVSAASWRGMHLHDDCALKFQMRINSRVMSEFIQQSKLQESLVSRLWDGILARCSVESQRKKKGRAESCVKVSYFKEEKNLIVGKMSCWSGSRSFGLWHTNNTVPTLKSPPPKKNIPPLPRVLEIPKPWFPSSSPWAYTLANHGWSKGWNGSAKNPDCGFGLQLILPV